MPRLLLPALALALACSHSASSPAPSSPAPRCDLEAAAAIPAGVDIRWREAGDEPPRVTPDLCFLRAFRIPSGLRGPRDWIVQFAVLADGRLAGFQMLTDGIEPELACAVWRSLTGCRWTPGRDAAGRPTAFWVKIPMRIR
ncbi:conserved hypothetical protein [Anaeromyxobacter dehalogenans 2CP-1]|uniref:TonB C-terminal domain-containing protein n=1 Tax=Anaeromyxobacter dehalogenans (strain ATCC BAA-258 / DSM 21875 / 2CP-1) TaxID=455488 RepID=B8JF67_ANAD2|nr:hypothetical protein [Anaeromyxobacter dehalogenans]ACL64424.1 conserved hypothetical protein [Anaeromyxobacter dehalogenans 2CP-1]